MEDGKKTLKAMAVSKTNLESAIKSLGLEDADAAKILEAIQERTDNVGLMGMIMTSLFDSTAETVCSSLGALSNIMMHVTNVNPEKDKTFMEDASMFVDGLLVEAEMDPLDAITLLTMSASIIANSMDDSTAMLGEMLDKAKENQEAKKVKKAEDSKKHFAGKREAVRTLIDELYSGNLNEEELAKKLAEALTKTK